MKDLIISVLSSAAVSAMLNAALIWLSKTWIGERMKNAIKHEYDEKLATHKAQLKAESEVSIERLKSQLQMAAAERNVRFSALHEKQAFLVAELYQKLRQLDYGVRQVSFWIQHQPTNNDWIAKASLALTDAYGTARQFFELHQIYFSPPLCESLRTVIESSAEISDEYFVRLIDREGEDLGEAQRLARELVGQKAVLINESLRAIEHEFRSLLGVTQRA